MTRFKLPEVLGGGEFEALTEFWTKVGPEGQDIRLRFSIPNVGLVDIPKHVLTEVPPPIPAEPEPGAYLIGEVLVTGYARRDEVRWLYADSIGVLMTVLWAELWEKLGGPDVTIRRLEPAPPTVEFPWYLSEITVEVRKADPPVLVQIDQEWVYLSWDSAEQMAAALLTAARAAREADHE